jgi:hypothetical protein
LKISTQKHKDISTKSKWLLATTSISPYALTRLRSLLFTIAMNKSLYAAGKLSAKATTPCRPGFDGGVLKTGAISHKGRDGPAIAELKQRLKLKARPKCKSKQDEQSQSTFTPFEGTTSISGGCQANTPLSLHSEMMAIQSALSLSSGTLSSHTSARSARWVQKPCFKVLSASKLKARLKTCVQAVCAEAEATSPRTVKQSGGKFCFQESHFEASSSQPSQEGESRQHEGRRERGKCGTCRRPQ